VGRTHTFATAPLPSARVVLTISVSVALLRRGGNDRMLVNHILVPAGIPISRSGSTCTAALVPDPGICQRSSGSHTHPGTLGVRGAPSGGLIHQWGLFPVSDLIARIILAASECPSGWGVRPLSWLELVVLWLWDVPTILWGFCASAPAKVLFAGADALLTTLFRGVSFLVGSLVPLIDEVAVPSPRSNKDLGLVVSPPARQDNNRRFTTCVVKGNAQKVDRAVVPDHLWIHAFLEGYAMEGEEGDVRQHLKALGLSDHAAVGRLREMGPLARELAARRHLEASAHWGWLDGAGSSSEVSMSGGRSR